MFDVPPSLAQVPVVLTPEVNGRQLRCRLDLTPFVTAGVLGAGDVVLPERAAADAVFASYRVTNDGRVIALVLDPRPGDTEAEVIVPNPTDRAAVIAALQGNRTDGLEDRFAVFLAGSHPFRDRLFTRIAESPIPFGPFDDLLPSEPGRFVYRFRSADEAGRLSAGAVMAACVVRVPSTLAPGAPDRLPSMPGDPPGRIRLHVAPESDIGSIVTFVDAAPTTADAAAIIRVPNRTDLPLADSVRLRTDAGAVLAPRESPLPPPDADGWRTVIVTEPGNDGDVKRLWAATMSRDGVPSALAGPWTLRWPPAPLAAPVLTVERDTFDGRARLDVARRAVGRGCGRTSHRRRLEAHLTDARRSDRLERRRGPPAHRGSAFACRASTGGRPTATRSPSRERDVLAAVRPEHRHAKSDVLITLPDPPRPPGAPIVQPGVARHAGVTLVMIDVVPSAGSFALLAPVTGTVRNIDVPAVGPDSITQLVELSPLPFAAARTFRKLPAGVPTFYVGYDRPPADPADDDVLGASEPLATVTSHAYLGVCFGDRTSLAPWSWIDTLAQAMIDGDEATADVSAWAALGTLYVGATHVRVLDHAGRPANGRIMDVRITPVGGATEGPFALTVPAAPADADLEVAAARDIAAVVARRAVDAVRRGRRRRRDQVARRPAPGDLALPVHSVYETGHSAKPEQFLALPAGVTSMHVMTTDVSRWFARRPAQPRNEHAREVGG